jgi:adenylyltransferase/sulfurtransferase
MKLLIGDLEHLNPHLEQFDIWQNDHDQLPISSGQNPECPACVKKEFESLTLKDTPEEFATLCGRDTVQIRPSYPVSVDLTLLAKRYAPLGVIEHNRFLLRFRTDDYTLVFFQDGRVLVQGTDDITIARSLYARYVGH